MECVQVCRAESQAFTRVYLMGLQPIQWNETGADPVGPLPQASTNARSRPTAPLCIRPSETMLLSGAAHGATQGGEIRPVLDGPFYGVDIVEEFVEQGALARAHVASDRSEEHTFELQ